MGDRNRAMAMPWPLLPRLPLEVWERILDLVDAEGLEALQNSCTEFRDVVVAYVMSGRLGRRARVSPL